MLHKFLKSATALCLAASLAYLPVVAAEVTLDVEYVDIVGGEFVATTMDGVPALYNGAYNSDYYCSELVIRYYEAVYGLDLIISDGSIRVTNNSDIYFVETDAPQKGDILYASPSARGKGYGHWALVKEVGVDALTLFEQNWVWNGQAGIDRVIPYPETCYTAYTMMSYSGALPERLVEDVVLEVETAASTWAVDYVMRAQEYLDEDVVYTDGITREQFCSLAVGVGTSYGLEVVGETAKEQAASLGLISNLESDTLTRQEAAVITARLLALVGTVPQVDMDILEMYSDCAEIGSWSAEAVAQMTACGLLSCSDGKFQPQSSMTVEQAAVLLFRVADDANPAVTAVTYGARPANMASMEVVKLCSQSMFLSR